MFQKTTFILIIFLLGGMNSFSQNYPKENGNTIRLLTYNTHYCKGAADPGLMDKKNIIKLAKLIKTLDADVVALQELDNGSKSRGHRFLLKDIAEATGIEYVAVYGNAASYDHGSIGCGVLVKRSLPIESIEIIPLPGDETRAVVKVELENFVFMGSHFDLNDNKRKISGDIICNNINYPNKPTFLLGDLNDCHRWGNGGSAFPTLLKAFTIISDTVGNTVPGRAGDTSLIDYVLLKDKKKSELSVLQSHILRSLTIDGKQIDTATLSDHYPVFVDFKLKN